MGSWEEVASDNHRQEPCAVSDFSESCTDGFTNTAALHGAVLLNLQSLPFFPDCVGVGSLGHR